MGLPFALALHPHLGASTQPVQAVMIGWCLLTMFIWPMVREIPS
jgi:hypothetical protein